jgi:hypothetical protein
VTDLGDLATDGVGEGDGASSVGDTTTDRSEDDEDFTVADVHPVALNTNPTANVSSSRRRI